ncbi:MAG: hypothetical protein V3S20_04380 [Dehalococcoidia bacterium]
MTQPGATGDAQLGVCLPCGAVWAVTLAAENCLTCGQPPSHVLPIPIAGGASIPSPGPTSPGEAPPAEPVTVPLTCPDCGFGFEAEIAEDGTLTTPAFPSAPALEEVASSPPPLDESSGPGADEPPTGEGITPEPGPDSCPTHPTEELDDDGKCPPCAADAEAALRRTATEGQESEA